MLVRARQKLVISAGQLKYNQTHPNLCADFILDLIIKVKIFCFHCFLEYALQWVKEMTKYNIFVKHANIYKKYYFIHCYWYTKLAYCLLRCCQCTFAKKRQKYLECTGLFENFLKILLKKYYLHQRKICTNTCCIF